MSEKEVKVKETKKEETKENNKKTMGTIIGCVIVAVAIIAIIVGLVMAYNKGLFGVNTSKLAGDYELVGLVDDGEEYSQEDLKLLTKLGLEVKLTLNEDRTGVLNMFGEKMELTYDNKNITIDGESAPYTIEDNKISFEEDNSKLVFQKIEE